MRRVLLAVALLTPISCVDRVCLEVPGDQFAGLLVYNADVPSHVVYQGSDADFHYFVFRQGDSRSNLVVRRAEAEVQPAPFSVRPGRQSFVKSARAGEIELVVPSPDR